MITRGMGEDQRMVTRGMSGSVIEFYWREIVRFTLRIARVVSFPTER